MRYFYFVTSSTQTNRDIDGVNNRVTLPVVSDHIRMQGEPSPGISSCLEWAIPALCTTLVTHLGGNYRIFCWRPQWLLSPPLPL